MDSKNFSKLLINATQSGFERYAKMTEEERTTELTLLSKAVEVYAKSLSPEKKAKHDREQAISFAYGNLVLSDSKVTKENIVKMYDEMKR